MTRTIMLAGAVALHVLQGTASVTDGDTIRIEDTRIRLSGIDAPETHQTCSRSDGKDWSCGVASKEALTALITNRPVQCEVSGADRYGRSLATCWVGGTESKPWMVAHGWAVAYRHYSDRYVPDEEGARRKHRNLWRTTFEMPWDLRAERRH